MSYLDEKIGKKVYLRTETNGKISINLDEVYTVKSVIPFPETNDWTSHLVLVSEDGREIEVRDYLPIVADDKSLSEEERIYKYLKDNGIYADIYKDDLRMIEVSIEWGDWKHDHGFCECLMKYLGYRKVTCRVTQQNGSDCYSATHYFSKEVA